jgi:hypothetical protein
LRAAVTVGALLSGCGGVDSGGTGAPATAFASGAITGFGSVIVTGVHFDERGASIRDGDGNARTGADLRLGMTVDAEGGGLFVDADGNDASIATSIVFTSAIVGPLAGNDIAGRTLTVLGQTVGVTDSTVFDSALVGGQAALSAGDVIEAYATLDVATGQYQATRIERKTVSTPFVLRGVVAGLDPISRNFSIGPTQISYAGLSGAAVPATLANGAFVRVSIDVLSGAGGVWSVLRFTGAPVIDDREQAKVEGLVNGFVSSGQFSVDGTAVDARSAQFPNGTAALANGVRVEVEGSIVGGVLVASQVQVESTGQGGDGEFDVRGKVASIDPAGKTFVVRNVTVGFAGAVDFRNGTAVDLAVGRDVEARGSLSPDGTILQAVRIDFRN